MIKPKISVIMAAYNSAQFLNKAILSVRQQTLADFELIIVNDCSSDNSKEIISGHAIEDKRIIAIDNDLNIGSLASRNKALGYARGEFIAILDSDDICLPDRFETQFNYLESHPDIALVGSAAKIINENDQVIGYKYLPTDPDTIKYKLLLRNPIVHSSVMLRKSAMDAVGHYDPTYLHAEDYRLYVALVLAGYKITNLPEILVLYRHSPHGLTNSPKSRDISLTNAHKVSSENIQRYITASPDKIYAAINTTNRLTTGLINVIKTIQLNRVLTTAYVDKENLSTNEADKIWSIYRNDRDLMWRYYLKNSFSWPYMAMKKIKYFLKPSN